MGLTSLDASAIDDGVSVFSVLTTSRSGTTSLTDATVSQNIWVFLLASHRSLASAETHPVLKRCSPRDA